MPKLGHISASKVGLLMVNGKKHPSGFGVGAITYAEQLAMERIGVTPEPDYKSYDMERGIENEWLALDYYQSEKLVQLHGCQEWITHPDFGYFGGTPDGLVGSDGGVDAKCPNNSNHAKNILYGQQVDEYNDQFQAYMFISGAKWWDLASFNDNFPDPLKLHVTRVYADETWQLDLAERLPRFWALVLEIEQLFRGGMKNENNR